MKALSAVFRALAFIPLLRMLVVPLWRRVLQKSNRLHEAAEWTTWVAQRWTSANYLLMQAETLIDARRFSSIPELLRTAKASLPTKRFEWLYQDIVNLEAMLLIEKGEVDPESAYFATGRESLVQFCYKRAWDAHGVMDSVRTRRFLQYYFRMVNYDPDAVFHVCDSLMVPNGLWIDIIDALRHVETRLAMEVDSGGGNVGLDRSFFRKVESFVRIGAERRISEERKTGVRLRMVRALLETGQFQLAREMLALDKKTSARKRHLSGLLALYEPGCVDVVAGRRLLSLAFADRSTPKATRAELAGEIAVSFEECRDYDSAHQYFVSSYYIGGAPFFLPDHIWRYVSFCMARNDYGEAAFIMRNALRIIWNGFRRLARKPIEKRLRDNELIPKQGAFFLGCWGIGDDLIRIAMFDALMSEKTSNRYGFSVDPRMQSLFARSLPQYEFVPVSRMGGPFAVSEDEYVRLRNGVPSNVDPGRVDLNVLKAAKSYPEVALTEDIMVAFIQAGANLGRTDSAMLHPLAEKRFAARQWLLTLPRGLNVGISWRSGLRDVLRNKSYTDLVADWGPVLSVAGVNFVNLQYSWDADELRQAEDRHGCKIYMMPGVDLKNDIEDIVALAAELDVVLAPGTAVREMCAAVGANVWSLSTTPVLPDLWRLDKQGERDRLFPNMIHLTTDKYGDAQNVIREVSHRLNTLCQSR